MKDLIRITSVVPRLKIADPEYNASQIISYAAKAEAEGSNIMLFPELALTGYTCADLFFQSTLLSAVHNSISKIVAATKNNDSIIVFGAPLILRGQLYNTAVVTYGGLVHGLVPKTFLPNYNEFYEKRWFSSSKDLLFDSIEPSELGLTGDKLIPVGRDLVFSLDDGKTFAIEICEDLWTPLPPSSFLALNGAQIILNLSASNDIMNKRIYRRNLVLDQSSKCLSAYVYTSAGSDESTTDLVFSGHSVFALDGVLIKESDSNIINDYMLSADLDLGKIMIDRVKVTNFKDSTTLYGKLQPARYINIPKAEAKCDGKLLNVPKSPFIPEDIVERENYCRGIFNMQVTALKKRLSITGAKPVVGVSGGLDSTLALLVALMAVKELGKPASDVYGITMPCFGTSDRTHYNSSKLMSVLGISSAEINIKEACLLHFKDIGHDPDTCDLTFENAQARERTQILMDYAGKVGGLVVGTGDLSELALGWCTYNADHMSMYGVNSGVPKTMIRWIIASVMNDEIFKSASDVLTDIIDTPISPELLPPDKSGDISQVTEDIVGPYELHDFFLYYVIRYGFEPEKIYELSKIAFGDIYDNKTLLKWLKNFYKRFFTQQYKRNCQPDGVKAGPIGLSPRGDWRMPSDASASAWLIAVDKLK